MRYWSLMTKVRPYGDKVYSNFRGLTVPKYNER